MFYFQQTHFVTVMNSVIVPAPMVTAAPTIAPTAKKKWIQLFPACTMVFISPNLIQHATTAMNVAVWKVAM